MRKGGESILFALQPAFSFFLYSQGLLVLHACENVLCLDQIEELWGGVPSAGMFSGIHAQPRILVCNCQATLLILHLWVRGQMWALGHWAPVSSHQARHTFRGNACFYHVIILCPVSLSPSVSFSGKTGNESETQDGWAMVLVWVMFVLFLFKYGSSLKQKITRKTFFCIFP